MLYIYQYFYRNNNLQLFALVAIFYTAQPIFFNLQIIPALLNHYVHTYFRTFNFVIPLIYLFSVWSHTLILFFSYLKRQIVLYFKLCLPIRIYEIPTCKLAPQNAKFTRDSKFTSEPTRSLTPYIFKNMLPVIA